MIPRQNYIIFYTYFTIWRGWGQGVANFDPLVKLLVKKFFTKKLIIYDKMKKNTYILLICSIFMLELLYKSVFFYVNVKFTHTHTNPYMKLYFLFIN